MTTKQEGKSKECSSESPESQSISSYTVEAKKEKNSDETSSNSTKKSNQSKQPNDDFLFVEPLEERVKAYKTDGKKLQQGPAPIMSNKQIKTFLTKKQEKLYTQQAILFGFDMIEIQKKNFNDKVKKEKQKYRQSVKMVSSFVQSWKTKMSSKGKSKKPKDEENEEIIDAKHP